MTTKQKKPFFSILIPSYNRPKEIVRNIDSILEQSFEDYEIIISDDMSPKRKEIKNALLPYLQNPKIKFFEQSTNLKEPNNKNFLVENTSGRYNIIIGDDDRLAPNALAVLKSYIGVNPETSLFGFGYSIVDEKDNIIISRVIKKQLKINSGKPNLISEVLCADYFPLWFFHPATFCCKSGIELKYPYQTDVGMGEDMWFIFEFLLNAEEIIIIPEVIFYWRKIQEIEADVQLNQSLEYLADFTGRKLIYNKLELMKESIDPNIRVNLLNNNHRKRFLYDGLVLDKRIPKKNYAKLDLTEQMKEELINYTYGTKNSFRRLRILIKKYFNFSKSVGFVYGIIMLLLATREKLYYKLFLKK